MWRFLKITFIIAILLSLAYFISVTDMQQVMASLRTVGFNYIYLLLVTFAAYMCATIGWHYCIQTKAQKPSIGDLFLIRHIGEMISLINPASVIVGEAAKVHLLQNKGVSAANGLTSILLSRVLMAVTQILLLIFTATFVLIKNWDSVAILPRLQLLHLPFISILLVIAAILLCYFIIKYLFKHPRATRLFESIETKLKLREVIAEYRHFLKTNRKGLFLCTLFFLLHWIIGSMEVYFILKFLGIHAGINEVIFVDMGIIIFKSAGVFVPGQIGVEEFGNKIMLALIGIPDDGVWMSVSVLRRSRQLFWICFGGMAYLLYFKRLNRPAES